MKRDLSKEYPHWAYPSLRAFRKQKRADAKAALKALDKLFMGCAFMPVDGKITQAREIIQAVTKRLRVVEWGR